jgi:signal transduction protein with GAF and PtsI domain
MQTQAIQQTLAGNQFRVIYTLQGVAATKALNSSTGPLLELCLAQSNSQGAYVYRLDGEESVLELIAWRGARPSDIPSYSVQVGGKASGWYRSLTANVVLEKGAWQDWRFQNLPEFLQNRFESVVSIPVLEEGKLAGVANFCRQLTSNYSAEEIAFLAALSLPLGSMLAKTRLESEVEKLNQQLADRKLIDRAKGVLQSRFGWTEEEAYYHIRRTSRQSRAPMRNIAEHVIQNSVLPSPWQEANLRD